MQRPIFRSQKEYGRRFTDAAFWQPYVEAVCRRHGFTPCERVRAGLPGTHPVFLVEERWVVKFFSDRFAGEQSDAIEREMTNLLTAVPEFPAPRRLAAGELFPPVGGWRWPYHIFSRLPGTSLGEVYDEVSPADREAIAGYLACWLKALHHLPLGASAVLRPDGGPFAAWLGRQRAAVVENHRRRGSLPEALIDQLEAFLPPVEALLDRSRPPLLLHGDMNADHLLGHLQDGRWVASGIIDFGDAKVGDLFYELVALHLGLFRGEKRLLRRFLESYGFEATGQPDFARHAMAFTLLHKFNVLGESFEHRPALREIRTLAELADRLWRLE
jgi:hygromycin-B 7''-O-kinase